MYIYLQGLGRVPFELTLGLNGRPTLGKPIFKLVMKKRVIRSFVDVVHACQIVWNPFDDYGTCILSRY